MSETPNPKRRATAPQTEQRITDLLRIRLDGAEWWDVVEFVRMREAEPGNAWSVPDGGIPLSEGMMRKLLARADKMVQTSHVRSRRILVRRHLAQRRNLYAKAVLSSEYRVALACLQDEAQLLGLYPEKKPPLPPLEAVLALLHPDDARAIRERLIESVSSGRTAGSGPGGTTGPAAG